MLSVKEKEKYVIQLREEKKTYKEIARELLISPRDISKILKKAEAEMEKKERKKIVLSKEAKALQLFKHGKTPVDVAIKLDLSLQEVKPLYIDFLYSEYCHEFVETFKNFGSTTMQAIINFFYYMINNDLTEKDIVEAIKMLKDLPKMKQELVHICNQLKDLRKRRDIYLLDNDFLIKNNSELNKKCNELLSNREEMENSLLLIKTEITEKKQFVDAIGNSEKFNTLKNKIDHHISELLGRNKDFVRLTVNTVIDAIREDKDNKFLINNLLNHENPLSENYVLLYEDKITHIVERLLNKVKIKITNL